MNQPGAGLAEGLSANGASIENIGQDTEEVTGVQVNGENIRVFNPVLIAKWAETGVKLDDLPQKLRDKIPVGFRLPTQQEIEKLRTEKNEKFQSLVTALNVSGADKCDFLTADESGEIIRSPWYTQEGGDSYKERTMSSTDEEFRKIKKTDLFFLVKAESLSGSNK